MSAEAENNDNIAEQKRQHGKRVRYGEIIQVPREFVFIHSYFRSADTSRFLSRFKLGKAMSQTELNVHHDNAFVALHWESTAILE
jgi:hypothetical protein